MQEDSPLRILNVSDILPNRFQPRIKFDDEKLVQLAKSIDRFGVIEPIVVRPIGSKYEVIAGERRFKASKLVSKSTIPAIVLNLTDKESEEIALLENVQRQSLSPIEEAAQYKRILDNGYISREELAKKLGRSESSILSKIRLLSLSDEVQSYLLNNKISERHARSLLKIKNLDVQEEFLHRIVNERLTVKATDREIREYLRESEGDTELLFDDERGIDNMDIDKIMREAKDINEPSEEVKPTVDLMANTNPVVQGEESSNDLSNLINKDTSNDVDIPVIPTEPNKFVNNNIDTSVINEENGNDNNVINNSNGNVTFDSMFSSPVNSLLQPENNSDIQSLANADSAGQVNNDINTKPDLLKSFDIPTEGNLPIDEGQQVVQPDNVLPASNTINGESNLLNNIDIPAESNLPTDEGQQVIQPDTVLPVSNALNDGPNLLNNIDIPTESNLPTDEGQQVIQPDTVLPASNTINGESNLLNNFDIPTESNLPTDEGQQVIQPDTVLPVSNALNDESNLLNNFDIPTEGNLPTDEGQQVMQPDTVLPNISQINENNEIDSLNDTKTTSIDAKVKKDISVIVADAFKKYSDMPETPLNNKANEVLPSEVGINENLGDTNGVSLNNVGTVEVNSEIENVPEHTEKVSNTIGTRSFADIVKMLRDCADNIENSGYMINVDEMDLKNEYKVVFTIKKD